jgi:RecB family exonuclease
MSEKLTLSPTKITTFLACPVRYWFTFVDFRYKRLLRARREFSFGTSLHNAIKQFHESAAAGIDAKTSARAALDENWVVAGYASPEEQSEALAEAQSIFEEYVEAQETKLPPGDVLHLERRFSHDFSGFRLIGQIDRIDRLEDGSLNIIDFKSQRAETREEDLTVDVAMNCYASLVSKKIPGHPIQISIYSLRTGHICSVPLEEEQIERFDEDLRHIAAMIEDTHSQELVPTPKRICTSCEFQSVCRQHPEFDDSLLNAFEEPDEA